MATATPRTSVRVVEAVAAETETDATALPPLAASIDPDAVDALLEGDVEDAGTPDSFLELSFVYADCSVTVTADGAVRVLPLAEDGDPVNVAD